MPATGIEPTPFSPETWPPLDSSALDREVEPLIERAMVWVPVLGWVISNAMWKARLGPIRLKLFQQLESRPENTLDAWGQAGEFRECAEVVSQIASEEMGWPCAKFLPWDPCKVVFWSFDDGLDDVAAIIKIEEAFELPEFSSCEIEELGKGTYGGFISEVCRRRGSLQRPTRKRKNQAKARRR